MQPQLTVPRHCMSSEALRLVCWVAPAGAAPAAVVALPGPAHAAWQAAGSHQIGATAAADEVGGHTADPAAVKFLPGCCSLLWSAAVRWVPVEWWPHPCMYSQFQREIMQQQRCSKIHKCMGLTLLA